MIDIVERFLRNIDADPSNGKLVLRGEFADLLIQEQKKSADEIERLRTENERLRKENQKLRDALTSIQWKAQDTIRPVPFQEDEDG